MKSLWVRKEKFLIAIIAIMLGAAMVASLLTISLDIKEKMGKELRGYGANLIVLPGESGYIDQFKPEHPAIIGFAPFLYFKAEVKAKKIELAGTDFKAAREMNPWWRIEGVLPGPQEVLVGINVAKKLELKTGDSLSIQTQYLNTGSFKVSGVLDTGTSDDDKIFIDFENAKQISGKNGATSIQVSVLGDIEGVISYLEDKNYKVKKIRQVAENEKALLEKTQLLMSLVAFFVLCAASLGLLSTMITSILERSREIGLMKALGCGNNRLAAIFLAEAGAMGIAGGVPGYFIGLLLAQFIGLEIFDMQVSLKPEVFLLTIAASILVAFAGSLLPVRRAISIDPAVILRGE
ncbi:MAG: ABC transporter permease [Candidatus Methanoperedens sp.]|nr:ABC transporter permease [Candidatus Methanoperedens sp.]